MSLAFKLVIDVEIAPTDILVLVRVFPRVKKEDQFVGGLKPYVAVRVDLELAEYTGGWLFPFVCTIPRTKPL